MGQNQIQALVAKYKGYLAYGKETGRELKDSFLVVELNTHGPQERVIGKVSKLHYGYFGRGDWFLIQADDFAARTSRFRRVMTGRQLIQNNDPALAKELWGEAKVDSATVQYDPTPKGVSNAHKNPHRGKKTTTPKKAEVAAVMGDEETESNDE